MAEYHVLEVVLIYSSKEDAPGIASVTGVTT